MGRKKSNVETTTFHFRCEKEALAKAREACKKRGIALSRVLRNAVRNLADLEKETARERKTE